MNIQSVTFVVVVDDDGGDGDSDGSDNDNDEMMMMVMVMVVMVMMMLLLLLLLLLLLFQVTFHILGGSGHFAVKGSDSIVAKVIYQGKADVIVSAHVANKML